MEEKRDRYREQGSKTGQTFKPVGLLALLKTTKQAINKASFLPPLLKVKDGGELASTDYGAIDIF